MSYNGIGLQTARGSGTSGYIQANLGGSKEKESGDIKSSHYKRRKLKEQIRKREDKREVHDTNKEDAKLEIYKHNRRRNIEVKCMELRDELEDNDVEENVIEKRITELRNRLSTNGSVVLETSISKEKDMNKNKEGYTIKVEDADSHLAGYKPRYSNSSIKDIRSAKSK